MTVLFVKVYTCIAIAIIIIMIKYFCRARAKHINDKRHDDHGAVSAGVFLRSHKHHHNDNLSMCTARAK